MNRSVCLICCCWFRNDAFSCCFRSSRSSRKKLKLPAYSVREPRLSSKRPDGHRVQEAPVVGDDHDCAVVRCQVLFKPLERVEVEVVRGLVEQQQGGLLEQQACQRDPHLPSAAELVGLAHQVTRGESQSEEHLLDIRFHPEGVGIFQAVLEFAVDLEQLAELVPPFGDLGHAPAHLLEPLLRFHNALEHRLDFRIERAAPGIHAVLRKVADRDEFRPGDFSAVGSGVAHKHPEQRRLARAVRPDESDPVVRADPERYVAEEDSSSELERYADGGNHTEQYTKKGRPRKPRRTSRGSWKSFPREDHWPAVR